MPGEPSDQSSHISGPSSHIPVPSNHIPVRSTHIPVWSSPRLHHACQNKVFLAVPIPWPQRLREIGGLSAYVVPGSKGSLELSCSQFLLFFFYKECVSCCSFVVFALERSLLLCLGIRLTLIIFILDFFFIFYLFTFQFRLLHLSALRYIKVMSEQDRFFFYIYVY